MARRAILAFSIDAALKHSKLRPIEVAPDLIEKLLELIRPRPDSEAACREKVRKHIATIKSMREVVDADPSTAIKGELEKLRYALKKLSGVASQLSPVARRLMFNDLEYEFFSGELDRLIEKTDSTICPLIQANAKGARPKTLSKMAAASFACSLMENYSSFPPTLTKGGRYFRVASLMYEAATGEQNADLTRYCSGRL
jgi:hypothetical protein